MKFSRIGNDQFVFTLGKREKQLLLSALAIYPPDVTPPATLSKSGGLPDQAANEQLLKDALVEQHNENRRLLGALLVNPEKFHDTPAGCKLKLTVGEVEWLLQVLNTIRVGIWLKLGAPEKRIPRLTPANARDVWMMEISGYFQMQLLEAIGDIG
jgi:hypothetical protein